MSTRCLITAKLTSGLFRTISGHFDGYRPASLGQVLLDNYADQTKVEVALSFWDVFIDSETLDAVEKLKTDRHEYSYLWYDGAWTVNGQPLAQAIQTYRDGEEGCF